MLIGCNWKEKMCCSSQEGKEKCCAAHGAAVAWRRFWTARQGFRHPCLTDAPSLHLQDQGNLADVSKNPSATEAVLDKGNCQTKLSQDPA